MKRRMAAILFIIFVLGLPAAFAGTETAAMVPPKTDIKTSAQSQSALTHKEMPKKPNEVKKMSGEVSAVGPSGIAVVYAEDEKTGAQMEMYLPFQGTIAFTGYKTYKEIREGDKVTLTYEETANKTRRFLKHVTLDMNAPKEEAVSEAAEIETEEGKEE